MKGKEWGQEGRSVLWRVGAAAREAPVALELQCAACGSGVSSSPAEHSQGQEGVFPALHLP